MRTERHSYRWYYKAHIRLLRRARDQRGLRAAAYAHDLAHLAASAGPDAARLQRAYHAMVDALCG